MSAVCVNIADPDENIIFATCLLTNNTGCYGIIYTLEQNASPGIYNVTAESYEYDVEAYTTFEVILHPDNHPPFNPSKPDGPTEGLVGEEYMFSTNTVDPDEDQIQYGWDWDGDMLTDEWTDLHSSGENITTPHIWDKTGEYNIRVKAKDEHNAESNWSEPLTIQIKASMLEIKKIMGGISLTTVIRNNGEENATNIKLKIDIKINGTQGLILLGSHTEKTIKLIPPQREKSITTIAVGIGKINITATLITQNTEKISKTVNGLIIGFIILITP